MPVAGLFAGSPMLAAWQAGRLNRAKDMRLKAEEERRIMAEHDSDMRARLAVLEEHMRINHEMHDILAHTLTVITVQAESGRTTTADPTARTAFADISQASREAVADLRALLSDNTKEDHSPEPTLDQFDELIAGYRRHGLVIDLHQEYTQSPYLPTGLSHAVYRGRGMPDQRAALRATPLRQPVPDHHWRRYPTALRKPVYVSPTHRRHRTTAAWAWS